MDKKADRVFNFSGKVTYIEKQEITVQSGATFYNGPGPSEDDDQEDTGTRKEMDEWEAIDRLLAEHDDEGTALMTESAQWYAVYRVMSELCGWPAKMSEFVRMMCERGYDRTMPPVNYESLKGRNQLPHIPGVKVQLWDRYINTSGPVQKQCVVARFLLETLQLK